MPGRSGSVTTLRVLRNPTRDLHHSFCTQPTGMGSTAAAEWALFLIHSAPPGRRAAPFAPLAHTHTPCSGPCPLSSLTSTIPKVMELCSQFHGPDLLSPFLGTGCLLPMDPPGTFKRQYLNSSTKGPTGEISRGLHQSRCRKSIGLRHDPSNTERQGVTRYRSAGFESQKR